MARTIQGGVNFDLMAAKMIGEIPIPNNETADTTFQSIQDLGRALIAVGQTGARTLTAGGTYAITNYKQGTTIPVLEADVTEIPINGDVGGTIYLYDENGNTVQLIWNASYVDRPVGV
jgi:hypothetical protein